LAGGIPNLGLDNLVINTNATGSEFNADGGLGFKAELIASETREEVGFSDTRVADQHNLEEVIVIIISSIRRH